MTSVLFVRLSAMGDLVQGLGAIASLHEVRPGWRLSVLTQRPFVPLLDGLPGIAEVLSFDRRAGLGGLFAARRTLRTRHFDHALDLQGNWKSAWLTALSGAKRTLGAGATWRREPVSRVLLQRTVSVDGAPHPALVAWRLVRELAPEAPFRWPGLRATAAECAAEAAALAELGIAADRPFRVVVVGDPRDPRALRPATVAGCVADRDRPVLLLLGPAEAGLSDPAGAPVLRHRAGELRRLVALGALLARAGGDVLGPDQGATHVLAAAGARCRVWFGSQDPQRTAPPAAEAFVAPAGPACRPCSRRCCHHPGGPVCMQFGLAEGVAVPTRLPEPGTVAPPASA